MASEAETILTPGLIFADDYAEYSAPLIAASGDAGGAQFRESATLTVPKLLYLLEHPGTEGAFTHLAVDVLSAFFANHHDWTYEVTVALDGQILGKRLFHKWYGRHQFLIPLPSFRRASHRITLTATPTRSGTPTEEEPHFQVAVYLTSKPRIWRELEKGAIWLFSTARSGSSWLAQDVLCAFGDTRPQDEPGIGKMFAPLQWDPERFFDDGSRNLYIESSRQYETGERPRDPFVLPMFERAFVNLDQDSQILNHHNYEFYHQTLRDVAFEHVLNEWGILDYSKLVFKMPNDSQAADFIMRACPNSNMIFLMRDGRDVMRSRFSPFASRILAETNSRELRRYAISFFSHFWNFQVDIIRSAFEAHAPERRILIRYENLRTNPAESITRLYEHLKAAFPEEHLKPSISLDDALRLAATTRLENIPESERGPDKPRQSGLIGGFREAFNDEEIALMNAIMGPNLVRYGYELTEPANQVPVLEAPSVPGDARRDIDERRTRGEPPANIIKFEPEAVPSGEPLVELPLASPSTVALLGEPTGFFRDGWVRAHGVFRCQALDTITSMSLEIWSPPGDEPLTVTLRVQGENEVTVPAPPGLVSVVRYALHAAPAAEFQVELVANREQRLSDTDGRHAAYVLNSISFS
jgi:hypothetical protein